MEEDTEKLTEEEVEALKQMGYGYPQEEEKHNIFLFFKKVIEARDNSKTANLIEAELGLAHFPVRTLQELSLISFDLGSRGIARHFKDRAQILLGTSLSREGFLDKLAVTQKREVESRRRRFMPNKGWFKKKEETEF